MSKKFIVAIGMVLVSVALLVGCGTSTTETAETTTQEANVTTKEDNEKYSNLTEDEKNELLGNMINTKQSPEGMLEVCLLIYPDDEEKANMNAVISTFLAHGYDEADKLALKVYEGNEAAYIGVMSALSTTGEGVGQSASASDVEIGEFVFKKDGNYDYVKGDITNNSSRPIRYIEIVAKYKDANGKVLDSDWTNCTDIGAGDSAYYEIMHKYVDGTKSVEVKINDVRFE